MNEKTHENKDELVHVEIRRSVNNVHSEDYLKYECFTKLYLAHIIDFALNS